MTMYAFHMFLHIIGAGKIKDTQCGFKLFTRRACSMIFPSLHVERWAFDVECLYLADRQGIPMIEVPVTWHEVCFFAPFALSTNVDVLGAWVKIIVCTR